MRDFRNYARKEEFNSPSDWDLLAVAQHHGLPTRCLDWTRSPLVGAHFACADHSRQNEDGVIWCLNIAQLHLANSAAEPREAHRPSRYWVKSTEMLEQEFPSLSSFCSTRVSARMLLWEPPALDSRISNQLGLLSILHDNAYSPTGFLSHHSKQFSDLIVRIQIRAEAKSEIRDMLDWSGVSERTLFPGLAGLCTWLRRHHSQPWVHSNAESE